MKREKQWRKPWAFLLALMLIVQLVPTAIGVGTGIGAEEVYATSSPTTWAQYESNYHATSGSGITDDYQVSGSTITIRTAKGLAWLANVVNNSTGAEYKPFGDNISLGGVTVTLASDINLATTPALYWYPIGHVSYSTDYYFSGTFEGNLHTISGMSIASSYLSNASQNKVGLFGFTKDASIQNVILTSVAISASSYSRVGGLAGEIISTTIVNSTVDGNITGNYYTGGLVGSIFENSIISSCAVVGNVSGVMDVGGLIGSDLNYTTASSISCSTFSGNVSGTSNNVGGLIGNNTNSDVMNCSATAIVNGTDSTYVGGLIGYNDTSYITSSYATGTVTGKVTNNVSYVGGLVGYNNSSITSCSAVATVSSAGITGGLVGKNESAAISDCSAGGSVSGTEKNGGLVGQNLEGVISNSYATADVTATTDGAFAGGLVGYNKGNQDKSGGIISNCYAIGTISNSAVINSGSTYVGGLIGSDNGGTITSSHAVGLVTASALVLGGGLAGYASNSNFSGCFWNTDTTGQTSAAGVVGGSSTIGAIGLTRASMQVESNFTTVGWDFTSLTGIWTIGKVIGDGLEASIGYPVFQWQTNITIASIEDNNNSNNDDNNNSNNDSNNGASPTTHSSSGTLYYSVMFQTNGGSTIYPIRTASGNASLRPVNPVRAGYTFGGWYEDADFTTPFEFNDGITGNTWLYAKWIPITDSVANGTFTDLGRFSWAAGAINNLQQKGVVTGISSQQYGPSLNIIRGDFMLMVFRGFGLTAGGNSANASFQDVASDKYYAEAIRIAQTQGIAKGVNDTDFAPQGTLTRQDAMVLIYRTLQVQGKSPAPGNLSDLATYHDSLQVSSYATEAVAALVKAGVIQGNGYGNLAPRDMISRAEMALILQRALAL